MRKKYIILGAVQYSIHGYLINMTYTLTQVARVLLDTRTRVYFYDRVLLDTRIIDYGSPPP